MASGYRDQDKLAAALELSQSFKHGGKSDTFGGVKKSKKKNASFQPSKPPSRPAFSARGAPNVSIRNYPNAGNFVAHCNNTSKGPPIMGNALDFLKRQDGPGTQVSAPKVETSLPDQAQATNTAYAEQPQRLGKREHEQGNGEERKDRIRKKLDDLAMATSALAKEQSMTRAGVTTQGSAKTPDNSHRAFGTAACEMSNQAIVPPSSLGHSLQVQPSMAPAAASSTDTNVWGNFIKFAPRGLVSHPQSEADTSPPCNQPAPATQTSVTQSTGNAGENFDSESRPQFQEFVPGGEKHHAILQKPSTPGSASSRFVGPASAAPGHIPTLIMHTTHHHTGLNNFKTVPNSQPFAPYDSQLVNPFLNMGSPQSAGPTAGAPAQPVMYLTQYTQPMALVPASAPLYINTSVPPSTPIQAHVTVQPSAPGSGTTRKPKLGLASSRWAS